MIDLCRILEKILHSLYVPHSITFKFIINQLTLPSWSPRPLLHAHQRSAFFDSCILELKTWYYDLPSELKIDRSSGPSRFPHAYTMFMVYHTTIILLCGPFFNKPFTTTKSENPTTNQHSPQDEKQQDHSRSEKAMASCSSSIRSMCLIIQKYRQTFGSFKMSPITATYCTLSAALIIIENCCTVENKSVKPVSNEDGSRNPSPHVAVGLCLQVLQELSTSWNIAKRIGRNLEKVYTTRFGSDHVPSPPQGYDIAAYESVPDLVDTTANWETNVPPLRSFDSFFDAKSTVQLENSPHLLHSDGPHHNIPHGTEPTAFDPGNTQGFANISSDELFANNLGFAFSPDCLPSDYNMFDTLNQMYLEETW